MQYPVSSARLPMAVHDTGRVHVFRPDDGGIEHYAIEIGTPDPGAPVLVRLHSACFTGDVLGSPKCDCGPQLHAASTAMADAGTIAVILPGAFYTLRETQVPPIDLLRKHGVPMALATDINPGSSPLNSLLLVLNMGCTLFRLTPEEALRGATINAALALGLFDTGLIKKGMRADLAVWDVKHPAELAYRIGFNPLHSRIFGGIS